MGLVASFILLGIFGYSWDVARTTVTNYNYTPHSGKAVNATITVYIGLGGYNITMIGNPINQLGETINYNEQLLWEWDQQGLAKRFSNFILRGAPLVIVDTARYLVLDGELIQFGRLYRYGGYYCYILLWLAFAFWSMSFLIGFGNWNSPTRTYAGLFLAYSGFTQLIAILVWSLTKPVLQIPLSEDAILTFSFGWTFYFVIISIVISCVQGIYLYVTYKPTKIEIVEKKKHQSADRKISNRTNTQTGYDAENKGNTTTTVPMNNLSKNLNSRLTAEEKAIFLENEKSSSKEKLIEPILKTNNHPISQVNEVKINVGNEL